MYFVVLILQLLQRCYILLWSIYFFVIQPRRASICLASFPSPLPPSANAWGTLPHSIQPSWCRRWLLVRCTWGRKIKCLDCSATSSCSYSCMGSCIWYRRPVPQQEYAWIRVSLLSRSYTERNIVEALLAVCLEIGNHLFAEGAWGPRLWVLLLNWPPS